MEKYTDHRNKPMPMNVEQVVKAAHFDYNPFVPLKYWLRTARTLVKEVGSWQQHFLSHELADLADLGKHLRTRRQRPTSLPSALSTCAISPWTSLNPPGCTTT